MQFRGSFKGFTYTAFIDLVTLHFTVVEPVIDKYIFW